MSYIIVHYLFLVVTLILLGCALSVVLLNVYAQALISLLTRFLILKKNEFKTYLLLLKEKIENKENLVIEPTVLEENLTVLLVLLLTLTSAILASYLYVDLINTKLLIESNNIEITALREEVRILKLENDSKIISIKEANYDWVYIGIRMYFWATVALGVGQCLIDFARP